MQIIDYEKFRLYGNKLQTTFVVQKVAIEKHSRGDHGMGGGDYITYHYKGFVSVKDTDGKFLAVCEIHLSEVESFRLNLKDIGLRIKPKEVVGEEQEKSYADFVGEKVILHFNEDKHGDLPLFPLKEPDYKALVMRGIILDVGNQVHLTLR
ncbi:MAG: hypothetical protein ACYCY6_01730 [Minisyncoccota bacterium]